MAAHQAPLSLGFSRQEHWSGLPFPSPMHASMLSCFSRVQLCVTLWIADPRLLCPRDSLGKNTGVGCHFLLHSRWYIPSALLVPKHERGFHCQPCASVCRPSLTTGAWQPLSQAWCTGQGMCFLCLTGQEIVDDRHPSFLDLHMGPPWGVLTVFWGPQLPTDISYISTCSTLVPCLPSLTFSFPYRFFPGSSPK